METRYDVIVVGGGHAGIEAAAAASRIGARTLLVTGNLQTIGEMSCNPAIGGVAKGTVVREVDALGGIMGMATDQACIQFRMLNRSKGPAVHAPRAQCDRGLYPRAARALLERHVAVAFFQGMVERLILEGERIVGVESASGLQFRSRTVVLTTGTFLRGRIHVGTGGSRAGGRDGEAPAIGLAEQINEIGLVTARFKTGTPPRIDGRTIDYKRLERQDGDPIPYRFSVWQSGAGLRQRPCWIAWTNDRTHGIIEQNVSRSALYGGEIAGRGPRYCPSIEDKMVKFPDAPRHQLFLEPEGLETEEVYVNGMSTSLPVDAQVEMVRSIHGLEDARLTKLGYAIEYDYLPPHQIQHTLASKAIAGLYLAGQINGTTGYEEAAGQGLVAGANAALSALGREPFVLGRDEAFIGVMIDDLVTRGTDEPYRLFTSRAEYRLLLRQDNAWIRLGERARVVGLLTVDQTEVLENRLSSLAALRTWTAQTNAQPRQVNDLLAGSGQNEIEEAVRVEKLVRRPKVRLTEIAARVDGDGQVSHIAPDIFETIDSDLRYAGYIARELERAEEARRREGLPIPDGLDYMELEAISYEARSKLAKVRPGTVGQAARVPGVRPTDIQSLIAILRRREFARFT